MASNLPAIEKLRRDHDLAGLESGQPQLDIYLKRYALQAQQADGAATYVGLSGSTIVGFYTLVFGDVDHAEVDQRVSKGLARHPIPLMVLARLAVHRSWQGRGVGASLLRDAMMRTSRAADIAGLRAFAAHAKDERAVAFYAHFGFRPSPTDALHMLMLLKDIPRLLRR
ncbi:MAG: GNAT family N-acetyltransferase [Pseudolabrys sp.]|jgi:GNAT superfamily N-acetyltransferase